MNIFPSGRYLVDRFSHSRYVFMMILLMSLRTSAQVYPVQVSTMISPPYSPYLTDYTSPGAQKLMVNFQLKDPTLPEYQGKLRITIEGVGITIRTKQSFVPQPLTLSGGGVPLILYGEDLAEYFDPRNLDFAGFSKTQYEKGAKLPEGVYRFTIEVLDYNRNTLVSNKGSAMAWIILNDPPLLNLPQNNAKVNILNPTNLAFTWTPRQMGSPNSAFASEYTFRLVEIWPLNRNPYDAFLSQPTLYEISTSQTQIVYGPAEPALIPGRKYAWQVQAQDVNGLDLFKNQGKSEVLVFQFGDALGIPENLRLLSANATTITVKWEQAMTGLDPISYRIQYRPHKNRNNDRWYEATADELWKAITSLQPDTEYEIRVRSEQQPQLSEYTSYQVFKTKSAITDEFVCKDVPPPPVPAMTSSPSFRLSMNDTLHVGGYDVLVREVTYNTNSTYTGCGVMIVPWFHNAKVRCTFENISVNDQFWLTAGEVKSEWHADSKFMVKIPSTDNGGTGAQPKNGEIPLDIIATDTLIKITGASIVSLTQDEHGNTVVETSDGKTRTLAKGKSYSLTDDLGNGYVVDQQGNVAKTTADQAVAAAERGNRNYNIQLRFEKGDGRYGYDSKTYDVMAQTYQVIDNNTYVDWKSVPTGVSDPVKATLDATGIDTKKITFELNASPATANSVIGKELTVNLTGKSDGMVEELVALYSDGTANSKPQVLGKLNVVSYDKEPRRLVLVPVNNNQFPYPAALASKLNDIYRQAVVEWTVEIDDSNLQVTLENEFDDGESGLLSNYTDDMKKVIKAYTKNHTLAPDSYYLFLVDKPASKTKLGYMPRKKQAGFIFVDNLGDETNAIKTIAHELAHGAFRLKHTFSEYPTLAQGTTDNLMDYTPTGTRLHKFQWDLVHNPEAMLGLFEGDDEGALKKLTGNYTVYIEDSVMKDKKIFTKLNKSDKLFVRYEPAQNDTITNILTRVVYRPGWSKKDIVSPSDSWKKTTVNTKVNLSLDSLPEGKYLVLFKDKENKVDTFKFYLRFKKYDFACQVCGRDLVVTLDKLTTMSLGKSIEMTENDAKLLTELLNKAGFNTCKSHAHFFFAILS